MSDVCLGSEYASVQPRNNNKQEYSEQEIPLRIYIIYIYEVVIVIICDYFPKLLKTHFFIWHIFRSHFGSFFCASSIHM